MSLAAIHINGVAEALDPKVVSGRRQEWSFCWTSLALTLTSICLRPNLLVCTFFVLDSCTNQSFEGIQ